MQGDARGRRQHRHDAVVGGDKGGNLHRRGLIRNPVHVPVHRVGRRAVAADMLFQFQIRGSVGLPPAVVPSGILIVAPPVEVLIVAEKVDALHAGGGGCLSGDDRVSPVRGVELPVGSRRGNAARRMGFEGRIVVDPHDHFIEQALVETRIVSVAVVDLFLRREAIDVVGNRKLAQREFDRRVDVELVKLARDRGVARQLAVGMVVEADVDFGGTGMALVVPYRHLDPDGVLEIEHVALRLRAVLIKPNGCQRIIDVQIPRPAIHPAQTEIAVRVEVDMVFAPHIARLRKRERTPRNESEQPRQNRLACLHRSPLIVVLLFRRSLIVV